MASTHVEGDQEEASPEHCAHDTLWYRRTEGWKVEYVVAPAPIYQLEDQVGKILELIGQ
jgi:hypothetical protein